ncbi:hypothetical protein MYCTH_2314976 [Thermothelomyces thermophilus ATCC 42464]|uniref:Yeast cell wall synthesis Kre9/Knh1-like N-terminal domain-containing protein n=1 Tax=Thermothelomyces thermophilus (strain ATCC 42464 / BCRC 31852 / DSM 1799) TaxID=573729 RepID=G2QC28_THET4|nr:uncharacterized protein MYCTH_2314976 [Thermothelomyces thermophilus ATCC 42464]AEO57255.1 hypothetical protein MYCTH_2314976 [Thermothelomyces thermophilus ATCC 42464]
MRAQIATLLALAAPLYAIEITSPSKNDVVDPSKGVTVKWTTVSTDPDRAHLVLVNMAAGHTPFTKDLGEVDLSTGSYTVKEKDIPNDGGYQFNFESDEPQNTGILAQSAQFEVKSSSSAQDEDEKSSSSAASASTTVQSVTSADTSTGSETTVTGTATTLTTSTGSASETTGASRTASASSVTSTAAAAPTGMAAHSGSLFALMVGAAAVLA